MLVCQIWKAVEHSADGNRRPLWLMQPVKPLAEGYRLPVTVDEEP